MDLCDEIYKCLQLLKDDQVVNYEELKYLIQFVFEKLELNDNQLDENQLLANKFNKFNYNQKKLLICIYCLFLEAYRLNTSPESQLIELKSVLDNTKISEQNKKLIFDSFKKFNEKPNFRSNLLNKLRSLNLDCKQQFIDQFKTIELTKDSVVKSSRKTNNYSHICQTEYLMDIKTENDRHLFTCSIQNIESMNFQIKEIMKTVDRLFTIVKK